MKDSISTRFIDKLSTHTLAVICAELQQEPRQPEGDVFLAAGVERVGMFQFWGMVTGEDALLHARRAA